MTRTILFIFGTRPEAIKLSPLILRLRGAGLPCGADLPPAGAFHVRVCVTAQHRGMLDQVLEAFAIQPDFDLDVMQPGQTLVQSTARIIGALEPVFAAVKPDLAIVQGDTTTTFCGALAAFYSGVPVAHVEAGLRTGDLRQPFPEELNRVLTSRLATLHFAATQRAADNLASEGITRNVWVTGNTGIDAVLQVRDRLEAAPQSSSVDPKMAGLRPASYHRPGTRMILVTAHRRESFGEGFERICRALAAIADRPGVHIVYPLHPNPNVQEPVNRYLRSHPNITLLEPLDYVGFVDAMRCAYIILTDSGGIQEEGPSLGKPILVLREKTERPEAVEAGTAKLVGSDPARILAETTLLLDDPEEYQRRSRIHNPYGDGHASERIEAALREFWTNSTS
jgi:UDP-N-acetylglucosamine 2-epimerase (non-hydrolysing)